MQIAPIRKAVVALIVPAVLGLLATFGIEGDMTIVEGVTTLVTAIVTAGLVWAIPNKA